MFASVKISFALAFLPALFLHASANLRFQPRAIRKPLAHAINGTFGGLYLPHLNQDLFLGIPFAQKPVDDLRLRRPVPLNGSWEGIRSAVNRGVSCQGYAGFAKGLDMGEDCLTLDVVRPTGTTPQSKLPVLVWIYGGGFTAGGSADPRYNTSFMVRESVKIGKPILAVSINYRLGGWGFLASREIQDANASNIGLFDQRLALRWIRENVAAFGGDPEAVTISGESAGAFSVGYHLVGFGGRHDNLFRAAIMQSGSALGPSLYSDNQLQASYQAIYDNVTAAVGCNNAADSLSCLRGVPFDKMSRAFEPHVLTPILDGDFLDQLPSESYAKGQVADVAILTGANTDEGTATFFGPRGTLQVEADVVAYVSSLGHGLDQNTTQAIMALYPDDPNQGCPFNTGQLRFAQNNGQQYKRGAAIAGDLAIIAGRRATSRYHSSKSPTYSYRFDQTPWNGIEPLVATEEPVYSTPYSEICFVFNLDPKTSVNNSNWIGPDRSYHRLAEQMSRAWISFVHNLEPNCDQSRLPHWPAYSTSQPRNMVLRARGSHVETDDWRAPQLALWAKIWKNLDT